MKRFAVCIPLALALAGCGGGAGSIVATAVPIAQQAALQVPAIASACATWRSARANPAIQLALGVASTAATVAGYGVASAGLDWVRSAGDRFCTEGPPAGDVTTVADKASWLQKLTTDLLSGR